jgi:photosystem II stability/assembly factor-like uncharacterized protein
MQVNRILVAFFLFLLIPGTIRSQWVKDTSPYYGYQSLAVMGNNLIAVCGGEVFRSTDLGHTWLDANNGIEYTSDAEFLFPYGSGLFVGTIYNAAILYSSDTGQSWQVRNKGYIGEGAGPFVALGGDTILVSGGYTGLYRTMDTGMTWNPIPWDSTMHIGGDTSARAFATSGEYVFAGCNVGGVFRSNDGGTSWKNVLSLPIDTPVRCIAAMGSYVFAGVGNRAGSFLGYIYRSTDFGQTWAVANTGLPDTVWAWSLFTYNGSVFVGYESGGIYRSTDSGNSWEDVGGTIIAQNSIYAMTTGMGYFFAGGSYLWYRPLSDFNNLGVVSSSTSISAPQIQSYPNPFSQSTQITFSSQAAGYAEVSIVNMLGVEVARVFSGELGAGEHSYMWGKPTGLPELPDGTYECLVRMNGQVETLPVVLMR